MRFERPERVRYQRNPLVEVVCELRFPTQLLIQQSLPVEFQARLRGGHPILELKNEVSLELKLEGEGGEQQAPPSVSQLRNPVYEFISEDREWRASLTGSAVRLSTSRYSGWEEFEGRLLIVLTALLEIYAVPLFTRIGLRYRDVVDKRVLGIPDEAWNNLLRAELFSAPTAYNVRPEDCVDFQQLLRLSLDNGGAVNIAQGFVRQQPAGYLAYLIDADFYKESNLRPETANVVDILRDFNVQAGGLFRASITERLHRLLGPAPA